VNFPEKNEDMQRPRLINSDTQGHDYYGQVISLCFDCAQHGAFNVRERSLREKDISAPLNVLERSLSWSLSEVEVESK
jgi:hypothetical protein